MLGMTNNFFLVVWVWSQVARAGIMTYSWDPETLAVICALGERISTRNVLLVYSQSSSRVIKSFWGRGVQTTQVFLSIECQRQM